MTDEAFREIECPMSMFGDLQLVALNKAAEAYFDAGHQPIAFLIGNMVEQELERRMWNRANPEQQLPAYCGRIRLDDWSDADIGDALLVCWASSEHTRDPGAGELFDALGNLFVEIAVDRLKASSDPRSEIPFVTRNQKKGTGGVNPELN